MPFIFGVMLCSCSDQNSIVEEGKIRPIRVAVIGGMTMTGMWQELAARFESRTGIPIEIVVTGPKEVLIPAFQEGRADLLTMHSSDEATSLVAERYAVNLRPWTHNEQVIVGPSADSAGIRGMRDGAAALRKIAETRSPFVDARGGGRRLIAERLWHKAGIQPVGDWVLKDESASPTDLLRFAESQGAYTICGRIPVLVGKIPKGTMEILVQGDPEMRRPFVVVEVNSERFPRANHKGAKLLANYLMSEDVQQFLKEYAARQPAGVPLFFPMDVSLK